MTASISTFSSSSDDTPFIGWSSFVSTDKNNPDILRCKYIEIKREESEHSIYLTVEYNTEGDRYEKRKLPLKSKNSSNSKLLDLVNKAEEKGVLKEGVRFNLKTWKRTSKKSKFPIRDYILEVLS